MSAPPLGGDLGPRQRRSDARPTAGLRVSKARARKRAI